MDENEVKNKGERTRNKKNNFHHEKFVEEKRKIKNVLQKNASSFYVCHKFIIYEWKMRKSDGEDERQRRRRKMKRKKKVVFILIRGKSKFFMRKSEVNAFLQYFFTYFLLKKVLSLATTTMTAKAEKSKYMAAKFDR